MRVIEYIAYVLIFIGVCGIPGMIEFHEWMPLVLIAVGAVAKLITLQFHYE